MVNNHLVSICAIDNYVKDRPTLGYDVTTFEFPSQKQERKEEREPGFASNLTLSFRVLIRPY